MKAVALPTQAEIKEVLHYDPETGVFRWRFAVAKNLKPWDVAGALCNGYIVIKVKNNPYYAHRLAWVYMTGESPENDVDHEDRVKSNNSWKNLRPATHKQNMENRAPHKNNTSGFRGVCWDKRSGKWLAQVRSNKKNFHVGYFDTAEEAAAAVAAKRAELFTHDTGRDKS